MDYKALIDRLIKRSKADESGNSFATICSREDLKSAATAITDLLARAEASEARAEKAESEKHEAMELLHSYRHICGEKTPDDLQRIVNSQEYIDKMVSDMYKLLLSVESAIKKKDLSIFRNQGKVGVPENKIPFLTALGKIETEYEELLYMSCSAIELRSKKEE